MKLGYISALCVLAWTSTLVESAVPTTIPSTRPDDPFGVIKAWYYRGAPLPERETDAVASMKEYYREHSSDPDVVFWTAVAQSRGLMNTSRSLLDLTLEAAGREHPGAMSRLGAAYLRGDGVAARPKEGLELLTKAFDAGEPSAAIELSRAYRSGVDNLDRDLEKAEKYARTAVAAGFVRAHRVLSQVLEDRSDSNGALTELRTGAEAGDEDAMTAYAAALQKGEFGSTPNPRQAVEWMQKAAKRGVPSAQRDVAKAILLNYGGLPTNKKNDEFGRDMLQRAAAAKDPEALRLLARVNLTGELGTAFDSAKALAALNQAIELNDPASHYDLAIYYVEGLIVPRDLDRARTLMRRAEALGFKPATLYLRRLDLPEPSTQVPPR